MGRIIAGLAVLGCGAEVCAQNVFMPPQIAQRRARPPVQVPDDAPLTQPRVFWQNGEFIDGSLAGADDKSVAIKSAFFAEPVQLRTDRLSRVDFPTSKDAKPMGPFSVLLKNGDRLFCDVTAIAGDGLTLKSERHGELKLPLAAIQRIQRLSGGALLYSGPQGALGWKHYGLRDAQGFSWSAGPHGTLMTRTWNRAAMLEMEMPEKVEVDVVVSSTGPLRFGLCLVQAQNSGQVVAVETWQDDLVIAQANRFTPLLRFTDDQHSIGLRVCWDRAANVVKVFDWSGAALGEFKTDPMAGLKPCVVVRNKGVNLTLEHLEVRAWDGAVPAAFDVQKGFVETVSGQRVQGVAAAGVDGKSFVIAGTTTISVDQLLCFDAGPVDASKVDARFLPLASLSLPNEGSKQTQALFADGTVLSGHLVGIKDDDTILLRGDASAQPMMARGAGLTRLVLREAAQGAAFEDDAPDDQLDELHIGSSVLHGRLEGIGDAKLRWRLPGALQPVVVAKRGDLEVRRPPSVDKPVPPASALFFFKDGNVLGAQLSNVLEKSITLKSDIAEVTEVSPEQLSAIHFNGKRVSSDGFTDPAWQVLKGSDREVVRHGDDRIVLNGVGAFGHPSVLAGDDITFTMSAPQQWAALSMDLFVEDIESHGKGTQLHFICSGNEFWCVLESGENNSRSSEQLRGVTGKAIQVRLTFSESGMMVYANGMMMMSATIEEAMHKGQGLIFSPSGMWGSPTRDVEVSHFTVKTRPDFVQAPSVNADAKRNALTIPRFRRTPPPTHVLLAPNGDVLRGRIESADAKTIKFQSGLDSIDVPTERVAAAVWLNAPKAEPKPLDANTPSAASPVLDGASLAKDLASQWLILQDGSRIGVKVDKFEKDRLIAWAPTLGLVTVPAHMLAVLRFSAPPPNSAMLAYQDWQPEFAAEPVLPESGGQSDPLLNKPAPDFTLPMLGEAPPFQLNAAKGKVVVLDFWATWCGPCVASMPEQLKAMASFDPAKVQFLAVNQGEPAATVKKFIEARGWNMPVALDMQQDVGHKFGVEGIPHCVVINQAGIVVWSNTGYTPGESEKMAGVVRKLIGVE